MKTFDEFLEEKFDSQFHGTKDQYESAMDNWFSNLDVQELIDYGQMFGWDCFEEGKKVAEKEMEEAFNN